MRTVQPPTRACDIHGGKAAEALTLAEYQARLADLDARIQERTRQLHEAEGRFTRVFDANPLATTLQSLQDGRYLDANPAFLALAGHTRDEVVGRTSAELALWPEADVWQQVIESLRVNVPLRAAPAQLCRKDGARRDILLWVERVETGGETCVLASMEDATERLLLEKKFKQAQKMEAIGQVAAGIAHDFNNLLTVIQSYTALVLDDPKLGAENREDLAQVKSAAARAAALTRQLLVFSRRQAARCEPVDIAATFAAMQDMLRRLIPEHIVLEWSCAPTLPLILADEPNLEQVLMNLVVNARDAMPNGGRISLSVAAVSIGSADMARHPDARAGDFLRLRVADNGSGIAPDVIPHIFEPFFTTKTLGKGTGLGLSTVYAIVRQHAGWIEVSSEPAKGTTFNIFLPVVDQGPTAASSTPADGSESSPPAGRGENVLLVEDEETVRVAARTIITRAGYAVTEAVDAPSALQKWAESPRRFDVLVTDLVMPNGTNGLQLATQLRGRHPGLKVIIATGYSQDLLKQNGSNVPGARLLMKPFTTDSLLTTIRAALDTEA